jgi:hypothetical protein
VTSLLNDAIYMSSMLSVMRFLSAVRAALYDTHSAFSPSCCFIAVWCIRRLLVMIEGDGCVVASVPLRVGGLGFWVDSGAL